MFAVRPHVRLINTPSRAPSCSCEGQRPAWGRRAVTFGNGWVVEVARLVVRPPARLVHQRYDKLT